MTVKPGERSSTPGEGIRQLPMVLAADHQVARLHARRRPALSDLTFERS